MVNRDLKTLYSWIADEHGKSVNTQVQRITTDTRNKLYSLIEDLLYLKIPKIIKVKIFVSLVIIIISSYDSLVSF